MSDGTRPAAMSMEHAAQAIANAGEMVGRYRAGLVAGGVPAATADEMAMDLHRRLLDRVFPDIGGRATAVSAVRFLDKLAEMGREKREADKRGDG